MILFSGLLVVGSLLSLHTLNDSFGLGIATILGLIIALAGIGGLIAANIKKARWAWLSSVITTQVVVLLILWPLVRFGLPLIISMHGGDASAILTKGLAMPSDAATIVPLAILPVIAIILVLIKNRVFHTTQTEEGLDD